MARGTPRQLVPYRNPFRAVRNLTAERIDMGVDYAGAGPVYSPGPGVVTAVSQAWVHGVGAVGPGTWIVVKLTAGPLRDHSVYLAENVTPSVRPGQRVDTGTVIGVMTGQGAGIETGFAAPGSGGLNGLTLAAFLNQEAGGGDPGAWSTAAGAAYAAVLAALGAPRGIMSPGGPHGTNPAWLQLALAGLPGWAPGPGGVSGGPSPSPGAAARSVAARLLLVLAAGGIVAAGAGLAIAVAVPAIIRMAVKPRTRADVT